MVDEMVVMLVAEKAEMLEVSLGFYLVPLLAANSVG